MEAESGAKIAIRGKGSVKEGKGRSDAAHTSNQEEDLHCLIMADTEEKVNKAKKLIHNIIETVRANPNSFKNRKMTNTSQAASIPEGQNELKRNQLRELAALNGTLRDDENQACQNCGQIGHRKYDCPEQRNFTANIICRVCGNAGHMARDCPDRQRGASGRNNERPGAGARIGSGDGMDREYESLMAELGGGAPQHRIEAGPGAYEGNNDSYAGSAGGAGGDRGDVRPWQRGPTGAAAPWRQPREDRERGDSGSAAPPWANGGRGGGNSDSYGGYGGGSQGGYGAPPAPGASAAPWNQASAGAPPPPPGGQSYGYGYPGGYDQNSSYGQAPMGAPPGLAAPPGMPPMFAGFPGAGSPPPPPPPGDAPPPPPPSDQPPPPPPGA